MNKKTYAVSDDIDLLSSKITAAIDLRDLAVKLPFGYRKARKAAIDVQNFRKIFWRRVFDIYPELRGKALDYDGIAKEIIIKTANQPLDSDG